jgi:hypothetical protein
MAHKIKSIVYFTICYVYTAYVLWWPIIDDHAVAITEAAHRMSNSWLKNDMLFMTDPNIDQCMAYR